MMDDNALIYEFSDLVEDPDLARDLFQVTNERWAELEGESSPVMIYQWEGDWCASTALVKWSPTLHFWRFVRTTDRGRARQLGLLKIYVEDSFPESSGNYLIHPDFDVSNNRWKNKPWIRRDWWLQRRLEELKIGGAA